MAKLKVYYDLMSQPSRAVFIFCKLNRIPFESCPIALRRGEQKEESFIKVNPLGLVPAIDHDGFKLSESSAILQYLSSQYPVADNWYPAACASRARVDQFLSWHQTNTRIHCPMYFVTKWLNPTLTSSPVDEKKLAMFEKGMVRALDTIETVWLKEQPFLAGQEISIADLVISCELEQPMMIKYDVLHQRPALTNWYERVKTLCSPFYQEAHVFCERLRSKL